jgi:hypothetical protein
MFTDSACAPSSDVSLDQHLTGCGAPLPHQFLRFSDAATAGGEHGAPRLLTGKILARSGIFNRNLGPKDRIKELRGNIHALATETGLEIGEFRKIVRMVAGGARRKAWHAARKGAQSAEGRQGAGFAGDADRRRGEFAPRRFHRGQDKPLGARGAVMADTLETARSPKERRHGRTRRA